MKGVRSDWIDEETPETVCEKFASSNSPIKKKNANWGCDWWELWWPCFPSFFFGHHLGTKLAIALPNPSPSTPGRIRIDRSEYYPTYQTIYLPPACLPTQLAASYLPTYQTTCRHANIPPPEPNFCSGGSPQWGQMKALLDIITSHLPRESIDLGLVASVPSQVTWRWPSAPETKAEATPKPVLTGSGQIACDLEHKNPWWFKLFKLTCTYPSLSHKTSRCKMLAASGVEHVQI